MINKVILVGRLGADPEVKSLQSGTTVALLRVATDGRRKVNGEWTDVTEWHRVVCFGSTAEAAGKFLAKGRGVAITGSLQTRTWEKDGEKRYQTEVLADEVRFIGGQSQEQQSAQQELPAPAKGKQATGKGKQAAAAAVDDIPF